ncbi:uncharacterized protein [Malus domestica]|uniref:uncharacterized protein n=1 Tax=Malus domestica TaxID=3750 RepID=UPI0039752305
MVFWSLTNLEEMFLQHHLPCSHHSFFQFLRWNGECEFLLQFFKGKSFRDSGLFRYSSPITFTNTVDSSPIPLFLPQSLLPICTTQIERRYSSLRLCLSIVQRKESMGIKEREDAVIIRLHRFVKQGKGRKSFHALHQFQTLIVHGHLATKWSFRTCRR